VLWVALSGLLATNLLFTVFVVALPKVATGLHTSLGAITWVVTGPLLAYGVVAPLVGKAGDVFGHRRLFMIGITAETVAASLSASAPNAGVLIGARILGGMVGASIGAASMALVLGVFDKRDRVKALGFWSLVGAGGPVIGVAVGGPVIQLFGWRWMFFLQVPLLVIAAALAMAVLPERAAGRRRLPRGELRLDWAGAASIAACVAAFLLALTFLPNYGWSSPVVLSLLAFSVVAGAAFRATERRASEPIFPLRYLRQRNFIFPIAAQTFSNFAYLGAFFLTPLFLESAFGYGHNQSAVGFLSLPRPIVFSTIAPFAGYLAVRIGERTSVVVGTSAVVLSMGVFTLAAPSNGLLLVELGLVLSGVGLGVASPSLSATVSNEFAPEDLGTAAASQQLMNQVGTVAGIQVLETVREAAVRGHSGPTAILTSFHLAYLVGGAVALLGVAAAAMSRSTDRNLVPSVEALEALDVTERQPVLLPDPDSQEPLPI
jgi:MFS family permease